ncbi:hypothetical protein NS303_15290 [Pantoea ananatis]|jgi:hypothetical protein|nr:hypothetical protein NS303_15290 [Pantoea ananatis]KTR52740.1 hypothetical protein NS311_19790 [Pantoea ananatis]KTR64589.1 hypothetical protein RSA47_11635 [Pantoea ananatis]KTR69349.1 hypothetical protein NS296_16245 [Pantoea ananatis]
MWLNISVKPLLPLTSQSRPKSGSGENALDHTRKANTCFVPAFLIMMLATLQASASFPIKPPGELLKHPQ